MSDDHDHDHDHDHHDHGHDHRPSAGRRWPRLAGAAAVLLLAAAAASVVTVQSGEAVVVTRLGAPVRVVTAGGLSWKLPAPLERSLVVDRRLRTTATGDHGVLTKDGLSLTVQAYAAWRLPDDPEAVVRYVKASGNDADAAADQLRTQLNSSLETITGRFALADLVNTDRSAVRLADYESALRDHLATVAGAAFGIEVVQVGVERLLLPEATLSATVARMSEERRVAAEERQAEGRKVAGRITADADKAARIARAGAEEEAAVIEARARTTAAGIYGDAYRADPDLYVWLRSLDTLEATLSASSRLVLSTDAPPFQALVTPPHGPPPAAPAQGHP